MARVNYSCNYGCMHVRLSRCEHVQANTHSLFLVRERTQVGGGVGRERTHPNCHGKEESAPDSNLAIISCTRTGARGRMYGVPSCRLSQVTVTCTSYRCRPAVCALGLGNEANYALEMSSVSRCRCCTAAHPALHPECKQQDAYLAAQ